MCRLFFQANRAVVIYSSNREEWPVPHVRHRRFTDCIEHKVPEAVFMHHVPNPYQWNPDDPENTSPSDFYVYAKSRGIET